VVKCNAVDANGKIKLSRKALMTAEAPTEQLQPKPARPDR